MLRPKQCGLLQSVGHGTHQARLRPADRLMSHSICSDGRVPKIEKEQCKNSKHQVIVGQKVWKQRFFNRDDVNPT